MSKSKRLIRDCWFALKTAFRGSPVYFLIYATVSGVMAFQPAVLLTLQKKLLDSAAGGLFSLAGKLLLAYMAVIVFGMIANLVNSFCTGLLKDKSEHSLALLLIDKISRVRQLNLFESEQYHNQIHATRGLGTQVTQVFTVVIAAISRTIKAVTIAFMLGTIHWSIPLILAVTMIPQLVLRDSIAALQWEGFIFRVPELRKLRYFADLLFEDQAAKELILWDIRGYLKRAYRSTFEKIFSNQFSYQKKRLIKNIALVVLSWLGSVAGLIIGAMVIRAQQRPIGDVIVLLSGVQQLSDHISILTNYFGSISETSLMLGELQSLMRTIDDYADESTALTAGKADPINEISLQNVSFTYPNATKQVLSDINLHLKKGETVALVGPNGAGKTTLTKLILGLYQPTQGTIYINNSHDLQQSPQYRSRMSCVFQDFYKFFLTIRENVAFGSLTELHNDTALVQSLSKVEAAHLLDKSQQGLDTMLGKRFGGTELSGGEWQRLALARALMRSSDLLILDEPSASLDAQTEYQLYLKFQEIAKGKICVLISHRFSTVRMADRIIVLSEGRIVEQGTHSELMQQNGLYATMYRQQADRYVEDYISANAN